MNKRQRKKEYKKRDEEYLQLAVQQSRNYMESLGYDVYDPFEDPQCYPNGRY